MAQSLAHLCQDVGSCFSQETGRKLREQGNNGLVALGNCLWEKAANEFQQFQRRVQELPCANLQQKRVVALGLIWACDSLGDVYEFKLQAYAKALDAWQECVKASLQLQSICASAPVSDANDKQQRSAFQGPTFWEALGEFAGEVAKQAKWRSCGALLEWADALIATGKTGAAEEKIQQAAEGAPWAEYGLSKPEGRDEALCIIRYQLTELHKVKGQLAEALKWNKRQQTLGGSGDDHVGWRLAEVAILQRMGEEGQARQILLELEQQLTQKGQVQTARAAESLAEVGRMLAVRLPGRSLPARDNASTPEKDQFAEKVNRGNLFMSQRRYNEAAECFVDCLERIQQFGQAPLQHSTVFRCYAGLGESLRAQGVCLGKPELLHGAAGCYLEGLRVAYEGFDTHKIAAMHNKLGELYSHLNGDYGEEHTLEAIHHLAKAARHYTEVLYGLKEHTDAWVQTLEKHKTLYGNLQGRLIEVVGVMGLWEGTARGGLRCKHGPTVDDEKLGLASVAMREGLLWQERGRTRALLHQLGAKRLCDASEAELKRFDTDDEWAWEVICTSQRVCGPRTVFVGYSYWSHKGTAGAYVVPSADSSHPFEVDLRILPPFPEDWQQRLRRIHARLSWKELDGAIPGLEVVHEDLQAFHDWLVAPLADVLGNMLEEDNLVISPCEDFASVPFAALYDKSQPLTKRYVLQRHTVSVTPSLRVLGPCSDRAQQLCAQPAPLGKDAILTVGDPAYRNYRLRLEGSGKEADNVESLFGETVVTKLKGVDASVQGVLEWVRRSQKGQRAYQVLAHFAAHGLVNLSFPNGALHLAHPKVKKWPPLRPLVAPAARDHSEALVDEGFFPSDSFSEPIGVYSYGGDENPDTSATEESDASAGPVEEVPIGSLDWEVLNPSAEVGGCASRGLVRLSMSANRDGVLQSDDIVGCGFDWKVLLVVLGCCETALGQVTAEGVLGLPRALLVAGVPVVVVPYCRILDSASVMLMGSFFARLRHGEQVAAALRGSMLEMLGPEEDLAEAPGKIQTWGSFTTIGLPTVQLPPEFVRREEA